jgi:SUKH-4 immunity protein
MANSLTPEDFRKAWGEDYLVKLPAKRFSSILIAKDVLNFLKDVGLPKYVNLSDQSAIDSDIKFTRVALGLSKITDLEVYNCSLPRSWDVYWVFGEEKFTNGSAWYCIEEQTSRIFRIDPEIDLIQLVNSSLSQFATSLLLIFEWSKGCIRSQEVWQQEVEHLHALLHSCDSIALESKDNNWLMIINSVKDEEYIGFSLSKHSSGIF